MKTSVFEWGTGISLVFLVRVDSGPRWQEWDSTRWSDGQTGCADFDHQAGVPVVIGVLTTDTVERTMERAEVVRGDRGVDCADAAAEMVSHLAAIRAD